MAHLSLLIRPAFVELPENSKSRREPLRPLEERQEGFKEQFDYRTLFMDVHQQGDDVVFNGPLMLNLKPHFQDSTVISNGEDVSSRTSFSDLGHAMTGRAENVGHTTEIQFKSEIIEATIPVQPELNEVLAGSRAIYTKSKNNSLRWIRDWAKFYVNYHGVDTVLIYDNGSTEYSAHDLLTELDQVDGVRNAIVCDWPFLFGPQSGGFGKFDSDFFEYVVSANAQSRFLSKADGVIHADIDELVLTRDGRSVFEYVAESPAGYIKYLGRRITGNFVGELPEDTAEFSFGNFGYFRTSAKEETPKWAAAPLRLPRHAQWRTHFIHGVNVATSEDVLHRHFHALSTSWKYGRQASKSLSEGETVDDDLRQALDRAGLVE